MSHPGEATTTTTQDAAPSPVFVVFAEQEAAWVRGVLLIGLGEAGIPTRTEGDFAPNRLWNQEVDDAIVESKRIVLVVSGAFLESPSMQWIQALSQHFGRVTETWPVLPLKLERLELPPTLGALVGLDAY